MLKGDWQCFGNLGDGSGLAMRLAMSWRPHAFGQGLRILLLLMVLQIVCLRAK